MFASLRSVRTTLEQVAREFEPVTLSGDLTLRLVAELGAIRSITDGLLAKAAKRAHDTAVHAGKGDTSAAQTVARTLGVDTGEARRAIELACKLERLPATDAAVKAGRLSGRQAEMIADTASQNPAVGQELIDKAGQGLVPLRDACIRARAQLESDAARAERQHKARSFRMWTEADGMMAGRFRLTPEIGGQIKAIVDTVVQRTFRERRSAGEREAHDAYGADALAEAFLGKPDQATKAKGTNITTHIVIDHAALVTGNTMAGERCEIPGVGPVNVEWVRAMFGTAFLTLIVKNGVDISTVAHLGRHIPTELRTALLVNGRECDIDGCHARGYLEIDHNHDHAKGGPTSRANLGYLCYPHHQHKTKGSTLSPRHPQTGKRTIHPPNPHAHVA